MLRISRRPIGEFFTVSCALGNHHNPPRERGIHTRLSNRNRTLHLQFQSNTRTFDIHSYEHSTLNWFSWLGKYAGPRLHERTIARNSLYREPLALIKLQNFVITIGNVSRYGLAIEPAYRFFKQVIKQCFAGFSGMNCRVHLQKQY